MDYSYHINKYYIEYATDNEKILMDTYYNSYKVKDLRLLLKDQRIKGYSYRNKDELCLMLVKKDTIQNICNMW